MPSPDTLDSLTSAMANANVNDTEYADLISVVLALKDLDPNLKLAWEESQKPTKNRAKIIALVKASKFYQSYNSAARQRAISKTEQPGVWAQDRDKYKLAQKKRLVAAGITWSPAVERQVESAYDLGLDDNALDNLIIKAKAYGKIGGEQLTNIDTLKSIADSYGVIDLFDNKYWDKQKERLFLGETTGADIENDIKNLAKQAYPAFAAGFDAGKSLDLQAGYIKNIVATTRGLDPNAIKWNDPSIVKWLSFRDAKSGQFVAPTVQEVRTGTREQYFDEFAGQAEGKAYIDGLSRKILQDMGLA